MLERVYEQQFSIGSHWYKISEYWTHPDKTTMYRLHRHLDSDFVSPDIEECRKEAHRDAVDKMKKLIEGHKIALALYEGLAAQLGDDPSNLDKFKLDLSVRPWKFVEE